MYVISVYLTEIIRISSLDQEPQRYVQVGTPDTGMQLPA